ncbi:hypothetical protein, partial [Rhodovastum atsumiense]|uniref:hypothetical protein n=1 Tax=Rhodovastum atsumiense TaxID=504468 RepID=UPI0020241A9B
GSAILRIGHDPGSPLARSGQARIEALHRLSGPPAIGGQGCLSKVHQRINASIITDASICVGLCISA